MITKETPTGNADYLIYAYDGYKNIMIEAQEEGSDIKIMLDKAVVYFRETFEITLTIQLVIKGAPQYWEIKDD